MRDKPIALTRPRLDHALGLNAIANGAANFSDRRLHRPGFDKRIQPEGIDQIGLGEDAIAIL
jgi:hypothetical protein